MNKRMYLAIILLLAAMWGGFLILSFGDQKEASAVEETPKTPNEVFLTCVVEKLPHYPLSDEERLVVERIVMGEAGGEPFEGQMLVAQCILNGCIKEDLLPSELRIEYKYEGWHEEPSESVKAAVAAVFDDGEVVVDDEVLYFYAPALVYSEWHESQRFIVELGGAKFFGDWK